MVKKKIKDLNKEEIKKICEKQEHCGTDCPLMLYAYEGVCLRDIGVKEKLEKEIEAEE